MKIRDANSDDFVELIPISYQFGTLPEDEYDANWLMVRGRVRSGDDRWKFVDPSLLVWEAQELGVWLQQVGNGEVEIASPDDDEQQLAQVSFLEPNLSVAVVAKTADAATIRFFFSHESGRPDLIPEIVKSRSDTSVDLTVTRSSVAKAAVEWLGELHPFPERKTKGK